MVHERTRTHPESFEMNLCSFFNIWVDGPDAFWEVVQVQLTVSRNFDPFGWAIRDRSVLNQISVNTEQEIRRTLRILSEQFVVQPAMADVERLVNIHELRKSSQRNSVP